MITQSELKEVLHYNPETGIFTWLKSRGTKKKGSTAGSVDHNGYVVLGVNGRQYKAHQLAILHCLGEMPDYDTDHVNGIKTDNRIKNLRSVSHKENTRNAKTRHDNGSGFPGVMWRGDARKWRVRIKGGSKRVNIGHYDKLSDAVKARLDAELKYGYHANHGRDNLV